MATRRKRDHGRLCNAILAQGNVVQGESLSYKAFQSAFGCSVKVRAPGALINQLARKAESAGGRFVQLPARRLKLSQFDHPTSSCTKKPLKQRWHVLGDGSGVVQRDLYSAFLAQQVRPAAARNDAHPSQVFGDIAGAWAAANSLLRRTGWVGTECASVESLLSTALAFQPRCFAPSQPAVNGRAETLPAPERIVRRRGPAQDHGTGAVSLRDPPPGDALRTPCL